MTCTASAATAAAISGVIGAALAGKTEKLPCLGVLGDAGASVCDAKGVPARVGVR